MFLLVPTRRTNRGGVDLSAFSNPLYVSEFSGVSNIAKCLLLPLQNPPDKPTIGQPDSR